MTTEISIIGIFALLLIGCVLGFIVGKIEGKIQGKGEENG